MISRILVATAVVATALVAVALATPSPPARATSGAPADVIVDQTDAVDDVDVFDGGGTKPTTAQRKTIDLQRFSVTRTSEGVRLQFQIARITRSRGYDQVVAAQLVKVGPGGSLLDLVASPRGKHATAYVNSNTICLVGVTTSRRRGTVRVDVPDGCVPRGTGVLKVSTYTQEKNGSGPGFSEDTMRIRGTVALR